MRLASSYCSIVIIINCILGKLQTMHIIQELSLPCSLPLCVHSPPLAARFISLSSVWFEPAWIQMNFVSIADAATCWQSASFILCPPCRVCLRDVVFRTACTSCGCFLVAGSCWANPVHQSTSPPLVSAQEPPSLLQSPTSTHPLLLVSSFSSIPLELYHN